ncbi:MAG TPA: YlxR family protein [Candidatus Limnocylindria bacterium]|nr:YlxR family protein [Candidatus Limnocylindria bacterium]
MRTCVGCGRRAAKVELQRFVRAGEQLRLDPARRAPGRGAYLHRDGECARRFARGKGLVRSLRWAPGAAARAALAADAGATGGAR